jgi:hypothetical protein
MNAHEEPQEHSSASVLGKRPREDAGVVKVLAGDQQVNQNNYPAFVS